MIEELSYRTPCFSGWQQERWFTHCRDAGEFLGRADKEDLRGEWAGAALSIQADAGINNTDWNSLVEAFDKGPSGSPTAYVFRCLHCGQLGGYCDAD